MPISPPIQRLSRDISPSRARAISITLQIDHTWDGKAIGPREQVTLCLEDAGGALCVLVDAPFHGDPAPDGAPGPTWELWEHEVVELFVLGAEDRYLELEMGPHGHHLVLQLHGRRNPVAQKLPISFAATIRGDRWYGAALIPHGLLPPGPHRGNATAIHGTGAKRRYLSATPLPGDAPDFHRLEAFPALEIPFNPD